MLQKTPDGITSTNELESSRESNTALYCAISGTTKGTASRSIPPWTGLCGRNCEFASKTSTTRHGSKEQLVSMNDKLQLGSSGKHSRRMRANARELLHSRTTRKRKGCRGGISRRGFQRGGAEQTTTAAFLAGPPRRTAPLKYNGLSVSS